MQSAVYMKPWIDGCYSHIELAIAQQWSEELREKFLIDCSMYDPAMLLFVDETGCDKRSAMRRFSYSLRRK